MSFDFRSLSPADFEDLSRDLVSSRLGIPFEGFGPGPDGGIDGRHSIGGEQTILQAKHKADSLFSSLKSVMKRERKAIDQLNPDRYILATSQKLTPPQKDTLAKIIGPSLRDTGDILGHTELNSGLRSNPNIVKAHIKLWLSSSAVLDRFIRSAAFAYTASSKQEVIAKLRVYVRNPSFDDSEKILENKHVLIISGPPGVGKTTLAQMLAHAYVGDDWDFVAIQNLEDGFAAIDNTSKPIFFFDDFLGQISLDRQALAAKESELVQFIHRVERSKNTRFILTTRAYVYEEARQVSDRLGDPRIDLSKYVLDVDVYTRRIRARILYNHLDASKLDADYVNALVSDESLPVIVDHENYNPRIIEWMTTADLLEDLSPDDYVERFLYLLDHPTKIWDRAFREHIPAKAQHLLICLFFGAQHREDFDALRTEYEAVHSALCNKRNLPSSPTDFETSLKLLEGSFVSIQERSVAFLNPSIRDYLDTYLDDVRLLADLAPASQSAFWARAVWKKYGSCGSSPPIEKSAFADLFRVIGLRFNKLPTWRARANKPRVQRPYDLSLTERYSLLAEWQIVSGSAEFAEALDALVSDPPDAFSTWRDAPYMPQLISQLRSGSWKDVPGAEGIATHLESQLANLLREDYVDGEDLDRIYENCDDHREDMSDFIFDILINSVVSELDSAKLHVDEIDSSATLEDYAGQLVSMTARAGIDPSPIMDQVQDKLRELNELEDQLEVSTPAIPAAPSSESDDFDNDALKSLFATLRTDDK